jgi:hypothetical protein
MWTSSPDEPPDGDCDALTALVQEPRHLTCRLARRFVGISTTPKDATQESLIRIVTRLGTFERRSKFTTWTYTVGLRGLLGTVNAWSNPRSRDPWRSPRSLAREWVTSTAPSTKPSMASSVMGSAPAAPTGCCCASPGPQRAAHLFANVIGLSDVGGAVILECGRAAFRQRLSRTRRPRVT